jgi:hypothetical protein
MKKIRSFLLFLLTTQLLQADPILKNPWLGIELEEGAVQITSRSTEHSMRVTLPFDGKAAVQDGRLTITTEASTTTINLPEESRFAWIETHLHNPSGEALDLSRLDLPELALELDGPDQSLVTLGTGGWTPQDTPEGSYTYHVLADPLSRNGIVCGWLTQARGVGLFLPEHREGKNFVQARLEFGQMRIAPGATRETDTLVIGFFEDARRGLEIYADAIAAELNIQLPEKPNVYCTWYHRNLSGSGASTEQMLKENAEFAREHLKPFGLDVFQIDDHWQALEPAEKQNKGPVKTFVNTTEFFPSGMAHTAEVIRENGFTPGIWYMPFAGDLNNPYFDPGIFAIDNKTGAPFEDDRWSGTVIDASSPAGEAFLRERFKRIHDWGYRYIKVDGLHTGTPSNNIYVNRAYEGTTFADASIHDKDMTFVEAYQKGLRLLREMNPDTFILGCAATQNMVSFGPVFGLVDAMRVGPDNDAAMFGDWSRVLRGPDFAGNLWFLHNRVWYNDPDPIYVRSSNPLHKARWMAAWLAVSGAMNTTSMQYAQLAPERFDLIKRTLPAHELDVLPVDILEKKYPQIWKVANERMTVLCLLNWDESETTEIDYPLGRIGLEGSAYDVFDLWGDRYLGTIRGSLVSTLPGAHSQVLALRETAKHPQLLSTSRHITQGLMDVLSEAWDGRARTLRGSSEVVGNDPYEMRITCPPGFTFEGFQFSGVDATVKEPVLEEGLIRITIIPKESGVMEWSVRFNSPWWKFW